jgi:hypothetical protein
MHPGYFEHNTMVRPSFLTAAGGNVLGQGKEGSINFSLNYVHVTDPR